MRQSALLMSSIHHGTCGLLGNDLTQAVVVHFICQLDWVTGIWLNTFLGVSVGVFLMRLTDEYSRLPFPGWVDTVQSVELSWTKTLNKGEFSVYRLSLSWDISLLPLDLNCAIYFPASSNSLTADLVTSLPLHAPIPYKKISLDILYISLSCCFCFSGEPWLILKASVIWCHV